LNFEITQRPFDVGDDFMIESEDGKIALEYRGESSKYFATFRYLNWFEDDDCDLSIEVAGRPTCDDAIDSLKTYLHDVNDSISLAVRV